MDRIAKCRKYLSDRKTYIPVAGVMLLLCGCLIYAVWRSRDTNICRWADGLGLGFLIDYLRSAFGSVDPGDFMRYNLPDGLYCIAYIILMDHLWRGHSRSVRILTVSLIPVAAIIHETLQWIGIARGTFDPLDLLCYAVPYAAYLHKIYHTYKIPDLIHCFTSKRTAT